MRCNMNQKERMLANLPYNVIAVGNPCRIVREITEEDRGYYFKDRKFDVEDYKQIGKQNELHLRK